METTWQSVAASLFALIILAVVNWATDKTGVSGSSERISKGVVSVESDYGKTIFGCVYHVGEHILIGSFSPRRSKPFFLGQRPR